MSGCSDSTTGHLADSALISLHPLLRCPLDRSTWTLHSACWPNLLRFWRRHPFHNILTVSPSLLVGAVPTLRRLHIFLHTFFVLEDEGVVPCDTTSALPPVRRATLAPRMFGEPSLHEDRTQQTNTRPKVSRFFLFNVGCKWRNIGETCSRRVF